MFNIKIGILESFQLYKMKEAYEKQYISILVHYSMKACYKLQISFALNID